MQLQLHYTNYTTPQLQLHYTTTTTTAALHHTTFSSCGWSDRPGDHCNHCNHSKKHSPSVDSLCHPWFTTTKLSFFGVLFWKLPKKPPKVFGTSGRKFIYPMFGFLDVWIIAMYENRLCPNLFNGWSTRNFHENLLGLKKIGKKWWENTMDHWRLPLFYWGFTTSLTASYGLKFRIWRSPIFRRNHGLSCQQSKQRGHSPAIYGEHCLTWLQQWPRWFLEVQVEEGLFGPPKTMNSMNVWIIIPFLCLNIWQCVKTM